MSFLLHSSAYSSLLRPYRVWLLLLLAPLLLASCATTKYTRQRTLLQLTKGPDGVVDTAKLRRAVNRTARNYLVHTNDYLSVQVFANKGERLVDPNNDFRIGNQGAGTPASTIARTAGNTVGGAAATSSYLVQADGTVKLPLVDRVKVAGFTLLQVDSVLQLRYNAYYKDTFVKTAVANNRVIILGAPGGLVVPLANDNMNLLEVLALAGGTDGGAGGGGSSFSRYGGRTDNIRIIRGDLKNPQVQFIDLSTLEGMRRGNLQVEPNDIIYIQPVRRPFLEGLTDAGPVIGLVTTSLSIISFVFTIITVSRR